MPSLRALVASRWFRLLLSAALLAVLFYETNLREMRTAIATAKFRWLVAAYLVLITSNIVSAYRWALLARAIGFSEAIGRFVLYFFAGMYLNLFGPGTVAGDVGRVLFLAGGQRRALAMTTVVAHRAIGFVALAWIGAISVTVLPDGPFPSTVRWLAAVIVPATISGWLWGPLLLARLLPSGNRWRVLVERDMAPYWHDRTLLAGSLALAAVMHGLQIAAQILVARALSLDLPWAFFLIVVPLVNLVGTLPFTLQGVGLREAGYWSYLASIGIPREAALAVGLLMSAIVIAAGLTGLPAFLLLRRERKR